VPPRSEAPAATVTSTPGGTATVPGVGRPS